MAISVWIKTLKRYDLISTWLKCRHNILFFFTISWMIILFIFTKDLLDFVGYYVVFEKLNLIIWKSCSPFHKRSNPNFILTPCLLQIWSSLFMFENLYFQIFFCCEQTISYTWFLNIDIICIFYTETGRPKLWKISTNLCHL